MVKSRLHDIERRSCWTSVSTNTKRTANGTRKEKTFKFTQSWRYYLHNWSLEKCRLVHDKMTKGNKRRFKAGFELFIHLSFFVFSEIDGRSELFVWLNRLDCIQALPKLNHFLSWSYLYFLVKRWFEQCSVFLLHW